MNLKHPAILEQGEGWVHFQDFGPDTLDAVLPPELYMLLRLKMEGTLTEHTWRAEFEVKNG